MPADRADPIDRGGVAVLDEAAEKARQVEAGLDALDTAPLLPPKKTPWQIFVRSVLPPIVFLALLIGVWQIAYWLEIKETYALPSPGEVAAKFGQVLADGRAWEAISTSVSRGVLGFLASLVLGTLIGLLMWRSRWVRAAIGPIISGLQSLPSVAWVPGAIIWFGLTDAAIYTVVLLGAVPSIANGLLAGFDQVPPLFERVGKVLGLSTMGRIRHVLLPGALPGYLAGLKQGWAFSWRSLMAAELIAYSPALGLGLGQLLAVGRDLNQMELVITTIFLILVVGIAIDLLFFSPLERRILRNRGLSVDRPK